MEIGLRELRQNASDVVRRIEAGEQFTVTVSGRPAARMIPASGRSWVSLSTFIAGMSSHGGVGDLRAESDEALDHSVRDPFE